MLWITKKRRQLPPDGTVRWGRESFIPTNSIIRFFDDGVRPDDCAFAQSRSIWCDMECPHRCLNMRSRKADLGEMTVVIHFCVLSPAILSDMT